LALTQEYRTFSKRNFYIDIIYLFLSVVNFELGEYQQSRRIFASVNNILGGSGEVEKALEEIGF